MAKRTITCNNCKETKTYYAKGLCKICYKKQWTGEYKQRPEVKERVNANMRRYRTDPKFKQREKEYRQQPEVKQRRREYEQQPEVKEKIKEYYKEYYKRLGVKERIDANKKRYRTDPKFKHQQEHEKRYRKEYHQRPEVKETSYQFEQTSERKAYHKQHAQKYRQRDHVKKQQRIHNAKINAQRKITHGDIVLMIDCFPSEIDTEYHHLKNDINKPNSKLTFMWAMPKKTHTYIGGKTRNNGHWYHNAKWIKKLYCIDIKNFLEGNEFMV